MFEQEGDYIEVITILCEGESEVEYISKLQSYLENRGIFDIKFVKKIIRGGTPALIKRAIKLERTRQHSNKIIYIWVDNDIYIRNFKNIKLEINNCIFLYNHQNFEDFLIMHLKEKIVLEWQDLCSKAGHFEIPLTSKKYEKLLQHHNIFAGYKKGIFPKSLNMNEETFEILFANQNNQEIKFKSDFARFLQEKVFLLITTKKDIEEALNTPLSECTPLSEVM